MADRHDRSTWMIHVNMPQTEAELDAFREAMRNGTPFGDEDWKQEIMETTLERRRVALAGDRATTARECPLKMTPDPIYAASSWRAMTRRWISLVPSPMVVSFTSRKNFSAG